MVRYRKPMLGCDGWQFVGSAASVRTAITRAMGHGPCEHERGVGFDRWRSKVVRNSSGLDIDRARAFNVRLTMSMLKAINDRTRARNTGVDPTTSLPKTLIAAAATAGMSRPEKDDLRNAMLQPHVRLSALLREMEVAVTNDAVRLHGMHLTTQWGRPHGISPEAWRQKKTKETPGRLTNILALALYGKFVDADGVARFGNRVVLSEPIVPPADETPEALDRAVCDALETLLQLLECTTTTLSDLEAYEAAAMLRDLPLTIEPMDFGPPTTRGARATPEYCFFSARSSRFTELLQRYRRRYLQRFTAPADKLRRECATGDILVGDTETVHHSLRTDDLRSLVEELGHLIDGTRQHRRVIDRLKLGSLMQFREDFRVMHSARPAFVVGDGIGVGELACTLLVVKESDGGFTHGWLAWAPGGIDRNLAALLWLPHRKDWRQARRDCLRRWREDVCIWFIVHGRGRLTAQLQALADLANGVFVQLSLERPQRARDDEGSLPSQATD